ncbi:MAG: hypothetical protein NC131_19695, partial [Roseburia sp.]|nr:hypothetical protein [Roseburia sp.]
MKVKKYFTLVLTIFFVLIISFIAGCDLPLRGNLFDEKILKKYEVSWLERPQNVTNEEQYIESDCYNYKCEIEDVDEFESYVEKVFISFKERNYTVAYLVGVGSYDMVFSYFKVAESDNLFDFCRDPDSSVPAIHYLFFYSMQSTNEMKSSFGGKEMGSRHLCLTFYTDKN